MRCLAPVAAIVVATLFAGPARADLVVPGGGFMSLANGALDLGCTDLIVGGTLQVNAAFITNVRNVTIDSGGTIDGGSGSIAVGGNWTNNGTFNAGTSQVVFGDNCGINPATISGSTTFNNVFFVSATGKTWAFAVGTTQTIVGALGIQGTAGSPLQFRSTAPGQEAFINLTGTQSIVHVGVTDVWATGVWLAPYQENEGGGGNANRWFGVPDYARIPTMSPGGLLLLLLLLGTVAGVAGSRRLRKEKIQGDRQ